MHTWLLSCAESYIQLIHTLSSARVWGYTSMVETPTATLRIPFLKLPVISLEQLMGSLLTMEQCQLTDGSAHAWWQDYRHLLVKILMTVVSHGDTQRT